MASLRQTSTGRVQHLESEHFVGRAFTCNLRLTPSYVSAQHARLRWTKHRWELRDLGSSNGTFLNGERLEPRADHVARQGANLAFGSLDERWEMVDDAAPPVMAVLIDGGDPIVMEGDLLALPSPEEPSATIYRATPAHGAGTSGWVIEDANHTVAPLANRQVFECGGRLWRFCCPEELETYRIPLSSEIALRYAHLVFTVSHDEERVHARLRAGARSVDLGARAHHYLLVTLARRRIEDAKNGHAEAVCGWVDHEDLSRDPRMTPPQLNIDVFRIRKQFSAAGVVDAAGIIERRPLTRQLRIGVERLTVVRE